jgi:tetratricopeptide (TPR) repeat protein
MADEPLGKSTEEKKPPAQPNSGAGNITVGGNVGDNLIVGNNNTVNIIPEAQVFHPLHQLPQPPADFTGREELITQLRNDFNSHQGANISGLTGMGGVGKTALGLVVAHAIAKEYPDAQIFLDLKGTTAPLDAMDAMRHVILSFEPAMDLRALDERNMQAAYLTVLHGKRALIFLDNARSAEQIAPLPPPDTCAMLVTSRWIFSVPGLSSHRMDVMSAADAKDFLLELCPRINEHADELAKACAYLPLALRIAGSFLEVNDNWPVKKYLERLNDHTKRLSTLQDSRAQVDLSTDHPYLQATFDLSYQGLSEENRKCWRALGVFPGTFDSLAARAMWELGEDETLKLLGLLRRYSLLDYDETSSRYSLHDLLTDYACSQMVAGEEHEARLKHASHYKDVLSAADDLYLEGGENVLLGLRLFDLEWENIRTGQAWAVARQGNDPALAKLSVEYPDAGVYVLSLRQHPKEKPRWLEAALSSAREIGDRRSEGAALGNLGLAYADLGEARKAIEYYEGYLKIAHEIGDRQGEGNVLSGLGLAFAALGEARKAITYHEGHLEIAHEIEDRRGEGNAIGNLGSAHYSLGDTCKAIAYYEQQLVIVREIGNRRGEGNALGNLGSAYYSLGNTPKAIAYYEQQLVIVREIGDRGEEGNALNNLGIVYKNLGEARKAIEYHEQSLVIAREIGDRRGEGKALGNLGSAYFKLDEFTKAENYYGQRLTVAQEIGDKRGEGNAFWGLAICKKQGGDIDSAREMFQKALQIFEEIESPSAATMRNMLDDLK